MDNYFFPEIQINSFRNNNSRSEYKHNLKLSVFYNNNKVWRKKN